LAIVHENKKVLNTTPTEKLKRPFPMGSSEDSSEMDGILEDYDINLPFPTQSKGGRKHSHPGLPSGFGVMKKLYEPLKDSALIGKVRRGG